MCVCVCTGVCMYVGGSRFARASQTKCLSVCMYVYVHVYVYVYVYLCMCVCMYVCMCMYAYMIPSLLLEPHVARYTPGFLIKIELPIYAIRRAVERCKTHTPGQDRIGDLQRERLTS